jgi:hypothetical protein
MPRISKNETRRNLQYLHAFSVAVLTLHLLCDEENAPVELLLLILYNVLSALGLGQDSKSVAFVLGVSAVNCVGLGHELQSVATGSGSLTPLEVAALTSLNLFSTFGAITTLETKDQRTETATQEPNL